MIQNNQPVFLLVWVGSIVTLIASGAYGVLQLEGADRWLLIVAVVVYLLGVQLPTITQNVPLNNQLQTLDLATLDESAVATARVAFEAPWNRWNVLRTVLATVTTALLIVVLLRL